MSAAWRYNRSRRYLRLIRSALGRHGWTTVLAIQVFITLTIAGGDDGYHFYLRPYWPDATAPAWTFLLTAPTTALEWPLRWTALTIFTIFAALLAQHALGEKRWWIVLLNHAFVVNVWMGQIEIITMMGVALSWLVVQRKIHPVAFGIGLICLATKVQVGGLLIIVFCYWILTEQGIRALLWGVVSALVVIAATLLIYPDWVAHYFNALRNLAPQNQYWNASVLPFGLLALPLAFMPLAAGKHRRARMVACASLLASPYFAWYHPSTAMLLETRGTMMWLSWLDALPRVLFGLKNMGWITPTLIILWDAWDVWKEHQAAKQGVVKA